MATQNKIFRAHTIPTNVKTGVTVKGQDYTTAWAKIGGRYMAVKTFNTNVSTQLRALLAEMGGEKIQLNGNYDRDQDQTVDGATVKGKEFFRVIGAYKIAPKPAKVEAAEVETAEAAF